MPPFVPGFMESIRAMGYSLESAVADIIDNSIAANASSVDVPFSPYDAIPFISILDNGTDMSKAGVLPTTPYSVYRSKYDIPIFNHLYQFLSITFFMHSINVRLLNYRFWDAFGNEDTAQYSAFTQSPLPVP